MGMLILVLFTTMFLMGKVISVFVLSCTFIYYLFMFYIEVSANAILLKKENIKHDKLVVGYIILNMVNEFVMRFLGFVVLYAVITKV